MKLESPAFRHNQPIPVKHTCDGHDVSPALHISGVPEDAESLALIMEDPDSPSGKFIHWLAWNIPPETASIEEGEPAEYATEGVNDFGDTGYGGPCPQQGQHHYCFKMYALDCTLDLPQAASVEELERAMADHILDEAELVGVYARKLA